ncbi:hypothetical protein AOLI_G00126290 [Acnodon oligacanthus]
MVRSISRGSVLPSSSTEDGLTQVDKSQVSPISSLLPHREIISPQDVNKDDLRDSNINYVLKIIVCRQSVSSEVLTDVSIVIEGTEVLADCKTAILFQRRLLLNSGNGGLGSCRSKAGSPGRPRTDVSREQLELLLNQGLEAMLGNSDAWRYRRIFTGYHLPNRWYRRHCPDSSGSLCWGNLSVQTSLKRQVGSLG